MREFLHRRNSLLIILILVCSLFLRLYRLDYPKGYVFDEVYHGFTAKEYLKGSVEAWDPWAKPPPGVAFEWTHPPLAKEIMALSMLTVHSTDAWAWRLPGAFLGTFNIYLIFLLSKLLFKSRNVSLLAAFIFSFEGLNFVQSRTGMNDVYLVTFCLLSLFFFLKNRYLFSAISIGLALSSKWSGLYFLGVLFILLGYQFISKHLSLRKAIKNGLLFIIVPAIVYLLCYIPYFYLGYNKDQFIELQRQMWWYHSHLKATHDYSSPWWSWPLNLYPVWYFVEYHPGSISNIFASGNPMVFIFGIIAIVFSLYEFIFNRSKALFICLLCYFAFILPWAFSPRIMFLYHYTPTLPFLSLLLAYQLDQIYVQSKSKIVLGVALGLIVAGFIGVYPLLTGVPLPKNALEVFFQTNLTKDPFRR